MTDRTCSVDGCERPVRCRNVCAKHYQRLMAWGHPLGRGTKRRGPVPRLGPCSAHGCETAMYALGLCKIHYHRSRRGGPLLGPRRPPRERQGRRQRQRCLVIACENQSVRHGLCDIHSYHEKRHGSPVVRANQVGRVQHWVGILLRSERSGCVVFPGEQGPAGYGRMRWDGKRRLATHVVLEMGGSPRTPERPMALHSCDHPWCVNPEHLRWGTAAENVADMYARGRRRP